MDHEPRARQMAAVFLCAAALAAGHDAATARQIDESTTASLRVRPAEPAFWIGSAGLLATAWWFDDAVRDWTLAHRSPAADRFARFGYDIAVRRNLMPALWIAITGSHLVDGPATSARVVNVAAGVTVSAVLTEATKYAFGRSRPRETGDPRRFRPLTSDREWHAMPSAHASAAFSTAAALDAEFDLGLLRIAAYSLAAVTAWSRIYDDGHWSSDAVAGAVLGVAAGRTTVRWLHDRRHGTPDRSSTANARAYLPLARVAF